MKLSVVIPAYNEADGIKQFHNKLLIPGLNSATKNYEIIYVNDGSRDKTLSILSKIAADNPRIKIVDLSRNFGKEIATTAGLHHATGDAAIILDADGQHPPKLIKEFVTKWNKGAQVVVGVRNKEQHEGFIKSVGSKVFYSTFNKMSGAHIVPRSTDFRLIDRLVLNEFLSFTEKNRITRGLIDWLGFEREFILFDSPERLAGKANYRTSQLVKLAANSFISLSLKPLFFFGWIGASIVTLSFILGMFIIIEQFLLGDPLSISFSGPFMLGVFTSFLIGLVLTSQAITAAYLSHIYTQTQGRPLFVVNKRSSKNID